MFTRLFACLGLLTLAAPVFAQDVDSGPPKGKDVPALKIHVIAGDDQGKTVDLAGSRKDKTTLYVFVPNGKFSRPVHRFLLKLGEALGQKYQDGLLVAVWLTDDQDKMKNYLPKIANYYQTTAVTYFPGEATGPPDWGINDLAEVTVIGAVKGQVAVRLGYASVNETVVREVMAALNKAAAKE